MNVLLPVKFSFILMPRYLTDLEGKSLLQMSLILIGSTFFFWCLKITNSVFFSHSMKFRWHLTNKLDFQNQG